MAWRIDEAVVRGEIDNRQRGRVTGRIWFLGQEEPVELDLAGDAWRDVAGRKIEFVNPAPKALDLARFPRRQSGVIGDCTASRKVKIPDIPMDQIGAYYAAKKKWTWHWGNSLYLEWFSMTNGRVVIESASYQLTVDPFVSFEMTAEEEEQQRRGNAEAMTNFMERLAAAAGIPSADPAEEELPQMPEDPDDYFAKEKRQAEAEAVDIDAENEELLDRISERMEKEGPDADFEKIMQEELDRRRIERGEPPLSAEEEEARAEEIEAMNRAAAESVSELDEDEDDVLARPHPLSERAYILANRLMREPVEMGWLPADGEEEHPLRAMGDAAAKASAKFSAALNAGEWPPPLDFCASGIATLKRARSALDEALMAAEVCLQQKFAAAAWIGGAQQDLNGVAHECDVTIGELRARLERGFD